MARSTRTVEALHIIDVEASLVLEVFRAEAVHHAVAVPLDVVYARRGLHCPVEDAENEEIGRASCRERV